MTVKRGLLSVAALVAAVLFLMPVNAEYVERVGSDFVGSRLASCGPPVAALMGVRPGLGGATDFSMSRENAKRACQAAAGKRVSLGLLALLGYACGALFVCRRHRRKLERESAPTPSIT